MCREHGLQLTELAANEPDIVSNFGIFGVVKETGVDDEGLREFHESYFSFPLYRDENLDFYRAFGDAKITDKFKFWYLLNPIKIVQFILGMRGVGKRLKSKNLEGNMKGEGLKLGGIIVFGKDGEPKYAYPEITGSPLETGDILAALREVSSESSKDEL